MAAWDILHSLGRALKIPVNRCFYRLVSKKTP